MTAANGVEFIEGQFTGTVVGVAHNLLHLIAVHTVCFAATVNRFTSDTQFRHFVMAITARTVALLGVFPLATIK